MLDGSWLHGRTTVLATTQVVSEKSVWREQRPSRLCSRPCCSSAVLVRTWTCATLHSPLSAPHTRMSVVAPRTQVARMSTTHEDVHRTCAMCMSHRLVYHTATTFFCVIYGGVGVETRLLSDSGSVVVVVLLDSWQT